MSLHVVALDHLVVNVADVERSAAWYGRVLGMRREDTDTGSGLRRTAMLFGAQKINLRPVSVGKDEWFTADHEAAGSDDLCFLVEVDADTILSHLRTCGVSVEEGPVKRAGARGPMTSVYCRDPDGSLIEISSYGPSQGAAA